MRRLNKYELDSRASLEYLEKNLTETNELSSHILEVLNSASGVFYVLFPEDLESERIYDFNGGNVTPNVDKEICHYVVGKIKDNRFSCIFDDVNVNLSDEFKDEFSVSYSSFYEDEVYYVIKRKELSEDVFLKCMAASDGIWHSLCVVTHFDLDDVIGKQLDRDVVKEICVNAQLVMIGAYDGEGYIFWERSLHGFS